jgi:spermidine synthase
MKIFGGAFALHALLLSAAFLSPGCRPGPHSSEAVRVLTVDGGRKLLIEGRVRAYADTLTWESRLKYAAVMNIPARFFREPGRMLMICSGAGSIVRNYTKRKWSVDSAEPDSGITELARDSFGLQDGAGKCYAMDGRAFLESHGDRYNVILEDLVGLRAPDPRLVTAEFFRSVRDHLEPGGVFGVSVECAGWRADIVRSIAATLVKEFSKVVVLPIAEPPNRFGSIVLIAVGGEIPGLAQEFDRNAELDPEWRFGPAYQETHAWDNRFEISGEEGAIQNDARNTIAHLFEVVDDSARAQGDGYLP